MELELAKIKVNGRIRKNLGNIKILAKAIETTDRKRLHPIVVDENYDLIAGQRRLEACKLLGWKKVPVTIVNIKQPILAQIFENEVENLLRCLSVTKL